MIFHLAEIDFRFSAETFEEDFWVRDEAEWRGAGRWKAGDGLPFVLAPA